MNLCLMSSEAIAQHALKQLHDLFPSSRELTMTWSNVVKLAKSLYREAPGMDPYRPSQSYPHPQLLPGGKLHPTGLHR
jgi:zeta-carotene desaturase